LLHIRDPVAEARETAVETLAPTSSRYPYRDDCDRGHAAHELLLHAAEHTERCRTRMDGVVHHCRAPEHRSVEKATIARYIYGPHTLHRPAQSVHSCRGHGICRLGTRMGSGRIGHFRRRTARAGHNSSSASAGCAQHCLALSGRRCRITDIGHLEYRYIASTKPLARIRRPRPAAAIHTTRSRRKMGQSWPRILQQRMPRDIRSRQLRRRGLVSLRSSPTPCASPRPARQD
jgi:hypothetical protein